MFFVDKPYLSDFLKMTIKDNAIPVVGTDITKELDLYDGTKIISESTAIDIARESGMPIIYTTSENAIGWISKHLAFSDLPEKIQLFKDKLKFRDLTKSIFPNFYYKEVRVEDLKEISFNELPLPFIIKPSIGFFSMGVHKVSNIEEWIKAIDSILEEIDLKKDLYPKEVFNATTFIIEQFINGEEFAIDAYYNSTGECIILASLSMCFLQVMMSVTEFIFHLKKLLKTTLKSLQILLEK